MNKIVLFILSASFFAYANSSTAACTAGDNQLTKQGGWKWDRKSQNLMYSLNNNAISPAGGDPDYSGSAKYVLYRVPAGCTYTGVGQDGWRWDRKSQNLMYGLNNNAISPAGGEPDYSGSANYVLFKLQNGVVNGPLVKYQTKWKWDRKSQNLMYSGNGTAISPAGGQPNYSGSADYALEYE